MAASTIIPFEATHPGALIKDELDVRVDLTQKDLAMLLGVKPSFLNEIIKGKRPITSDIAILLEKTLGISADYWMKFQSQYELDLARVKEKNINKIKLIEIWNIITQYVPIKYFSKKGYITEDIAANVTKIQEVYSVQSVDDLVNKFSEKKFAFFKSSENLKINEKNLIAWTSLIEFEADKKETNTFHFENLPQLKRELKEIFFVNNNFLELVDNKLSHYGIKFLLVDKFDQKSIDGYAFWSKDNPVIALSLKHHRNDHLAFTILNELGYIASHLNGAKEVRLIVSSKVE